MLRTIPGVCQPAYRSRSGKNPNGMKMPANILITGASRGLGRALALAYLRDGANTAICARSADELAAVEQEAHALPGDCLALETDVTVAAQIERWVETATSRWGPPTALINNASLLGPRVPLKDFPEAEWRAAIDVNVTGTFLATRAVLPAMLEAGAGSIINVSSGAAISPRREWGVYAVSKNAVEAFSRNLAAELEGTGLRVNIVDPGAMRTDMRAAAYPEEDPLTLKEPADIFPLFDWLTGVGSERVTGERYQADEWLAAQS